jgi:hypothetical protein
MQKERLRRVDALSFDLMQLKSGERHLNRKPCLVFILAGAAGLEQLPTLC